MKQSILTSVLAAVITFSYTVSDAEAFRFTKRGAGVDSPCYSATEHERRSAHLYEDSVLEFENVFNRKRNTGKFFHGLDTMLKNQGDIYKAKTISQKLWKIENFEETVLIFLITS